MNISNHTLDLLKDMFLSFTFWDESANEVPVNVATRLRIGFDKEGYYIGKEIKATKKETTLEHIVSKLNSEKVYQNFSRYFNKLISVHNLHAYPTSYGIGVFVLFNFKGSADKAKTEIEEKLNSLGVGYSTEYSEAGWVFRYKISKSKENIQLIEKLTSN